MRTKAGVYEDVWFFLVPLQAYARVHTRTHAHTLAGPLKSSRRALPLLVAWQGVDKTHKTKSTWAWLMRRGQACILTLTPAVWILLRCQLL